MQVQSEKNNYLWKESLSLLGAPYEEKWKTKLNENQYSTLTYSSGQKAILNPSLVLVLSRFSFFFSFLTGFVSNGSPPVLLKPTCSLDHPLALIRAWYFKIKKDDLRVPKLIALFDRFWLTRWKPSMNCKMFKGHWPKLNVKSHFTMCCHSERWPHFAEVNYMCCRICKYWVGQVLISVNLKMTAGRQKFYWTVESSRRLQGVF